MWPLSYIAVLHFEITCEMRFKFDIIFVITLLHYYTTTNYQNEVIFQLLLGSTVAEAISHFLTHFKHLK